MTREKQIRVSGINIVTHPHSPDGYIKLFQAAFKLRQAAQLRGAEYAMLGELRFLNKDDPLEGLTGRIYRFVQIDPTASWFNLEKHETASEEELSKIMIPENLRPNLVMFNFVFYPKRHWLYFESKFGNHTLGPQSVAKLLLTVFSRQEIVDEFGTVDVTVIPEREQLEKILRIPKLNHLIIDLTRPNPDDLDDEDARVLKRLNDQNAKRIRQEIFAAPHESIKPDDDTKTLARVASRNGSVKGTGYSADGLPVIEATVDHPWREAIRYNPEMQTPVDALIAETRQLNHDGI